MVLDNIPLRPEGYYLSTADYNGNRGEAFVMVTVRNTGTRAAFINGQSFQGKFRKFIDSLVGISICIFSQLYVVKFSLIFKSSGYEVSLWLEKLC